MVKEQSLFCIKWIKLQFDSTDLYWVFAVCGAGTILGPGNVLVNEKD